MALTCLVRAYMAVPATAAAAVAVMIGAQFSDAA